MSWTIQCLHLNIAEDQNFSQLFLGTLQAPSLRSEVVVLALSIGLGQQNNRSAPNPYKNRDPAANTEGKVNMTSSYWWK